MPDKDWNDAILDPPAVDIDVAMPLVAAAVEDAISCIQQHALPYFASVANWSKAG